MYVETELRLYLVYGTRGSLDQDQDPILFITTTLSRALCDTQVVVRDGARREEGDPDDELEFEVRQIDAGSTETAA